MSTVYHRCACPHCQQDLEYPTELAAQVIDCPTCAKPLTLPVAVAAQSKRSLFQRMKDAGQAVLDKRKLKAIVLATVSDGVLTPDEVAQIESLLAEKGIDRNVISEWSDDILTRAVDSINRTNLSADRLQGIDAIIRTLGVVSEKPMERLNRWRYIAAIRDGKLPVENVENLVLRDAERVHWVEPAKLWEEKVVSRRYEGGSTGASFRIAKGFTIRTSGTRGQLVTDTADVQVSEGNFIITSNRLIFQGESKSFETKYEKILDIHNHLDGIRYSESNKQKPRKIQYYSANGDIIVEILSHLFGRRNTNFGI